MEQLKNKLVYLEQVYCHESTRLKEPVERDVKLRPYKRFNAEAMSLYLLTEIVRQREAMGLIHGNNHV